MGAWSWSLALLGSLLLSAGQTPEASVSTGADEIAEPAPVEEGSLEELVGDVVTSAEESLSEIVGTAEDAAESVEEDISETVGAEPDVDDDPGVSEEEDAMDADGELMDGDDLVEPSVHVTMGHAFIEYNGHLNTLAGHESGRASRMVVHTGMLSLTQAKEWCAQHNNCAGFYHKGVADEGPFDMTFTSNWDLNVDTQDEVPHTAYKKEGLEEEPGPADAPPEAEMEAMDEDVEDELPPDEEAEDAEEASAAEEVTSFHKDHERSSRSAVGANQGSRAATGVRVGSLRGRGGMKTHGPKTVKSGREL